jgi:hypothetical protein
VSEALLARFATGAPASGQVVISAFLDLCALESA